VPTCEPTRIKWRSGMEPKVADFDIVIRDELNVERHFQVWESTRPGSTLNQIQLPGRRCWTRQSGIPNKVQADFSSVPDMKGAVLPTLTSRCATCNRRHSHSREFAGCIILFCLLAVFGLNRTQLGFQAPEFPEGWFPSFGSSP
jgi:hypothetical protein